MLFSDRPLQRASARLPTSLSVARSIARLARSRGARTRGGGAVRTAAAGDSARDAMSSGGGLGKSGSGTGARPVGITSGALARPVWIASAALDCAGGDILAVCLPVTSSVDGGLKMAALAVPATTRKARASVTRFMEANPLTTR